MADKENKKLQKQLVDGVPYGEKQDDGTYKTKKKRKVWKTILLVLLAILVLIILVVGGYVVYVLAQYSRIEDNQTLNVNGDNGEEAPVGEELTYTSYNIGFGAYSNEYSFFMDEGIMADGSASVGTHARALSYEDCNTNTEGSIDILRELNSDFIAVQEVDTASERSYHINQQERIEEEFSEYNQTYAVNFHSAYLCYPLNEPIGTCNSGIETLSKYKIESAVRKSYTLSTGFDKLFNLERSISVNYIPKAQEKNLFLINSHMSAYDEGGTIRNQQLKELNSFMLEEYNKGNYVICGGDFNHDLLTYNPNAEGSYTTESLPFGDTFTQQIPEWCSFMFDENGNCNFDSHFSVRAGENTPSLRGADMPYDPAVTYVSSVDGFVVSDNVEFVSVINTDVSDNDTDKFAYSDHQPATLTFKLIA